MKVLRLLLVLTFSVILLAACGSENTSGADEDKTTIKVGTSPGPYSELFLDAIKPILEDEGYTIETIDFTELLQADIALDEGSIDLNVDQHTAYYKNFNDEKGANLTSITPIPTVPTGIFPGRKDTLDEIDDVDVVVIPKDPYTSA